MENSIHGIVLLNFCANPARPSVLHLPRAHELIAPSFCKRNNNTNLRPRSCSYILNWKPKERESKASINFNPSKTDKESSKPTKLPE